MSGVKFQQRMSIRCPKCCKNYGPRDRHGHLTSPLRGWPGWEFTRAGEPEAKTTKRTDGRTVKVKVRCLRCRHEWWTVMAEAVWRAAALYGADSSGRHGVLAFSNLLRDVREEQHG